MRVLLADHDYDLLEAMTRATRDICVLDAVTSKEHCIDLLRANEFDLVVACERLADGSGLELLGQLDKRWPSSLRVFAADEQRLDLLRGRLGPFRLFQTLGYPFQAPQLRKTLMAAKESLELVDDDDIPAVQHIVLETVPEPEAIQVMRKGRGIKKTSKMLRSEHAASQAIVRKATQLSGVKDVRSDSKGERNNVVVVTRDKLCLDNVAASVAGRSLAVTHASDESALARAIKADDALMYVVDLGASGTASGKLLEKVCAAAEHSYVMAIGRADDASLVAPLLAEGTLHRFLVKPLSRAQTRTAVETVIGAAAPKRTMQSQDPALFASLIDRASAQNLQRAMERSRGRFRPEHRKYLAAGAGAIACLMLTVAFWNGGSESVASEKGTHPKMRKVSGKMTPVEQIEQQIEDALVTDDIPNARKGLASLHQLRPNHPQLAFYQTLITRSEQRRANPARDVPVDD